MIMDFFQTQLKSFITDIFANKFLLMILTWKMHNFNLSYVPLKNPFKIHI